MELLKRVLILVALLALCGGCTSKPYTIKTTIENGVQTDRVCTHKTAIIPWYVGVAGGIFTYKYGQECQDVITKEVNHDTN
jgi:hypothetical protein